MISESATRISPDLSRIGSIQNHVDRIIDDLLATLPKPDRLSAEQRRGIIARYTTVLEGNFIYWMTGAWLAVKSDAARSKIVENLHEEVRDAHPLMMRKFAMAAGALPTTADTLAVHHSLTDVRLFIGRLSSVRIIVTMAFFEGLIQRFMPYLAELARLQGSSEMEYTDVHGVCDITHTAELYNALEAEMKLADEPVPAATFFEGIGLLRTLIENIVTGTVPVVRTEKEHDVAYGDRARHVMSPGNGASAVPAQA
jgi:hypothetical protein